MNFIKPISKFILSHVYVTYQCNKLTLFEAIPCPPFLVTFLLNILQHIDVRVGILNLIYYLVLLTHCLTRWKCRKLVLFQFTATGLFFSITSSNDTPIHQSNNLRSDNCRVNSIEHKVKMKNHRFLNADLVLIDVKWIDDKKEYLPRSHDCRSHTAQKLKISIDYFFSKCDQIRCFLRIW